MSIASSLEEAFLESKFFTAIEDDSVEFKKTIELLTSETKNHKKLMDDLKDKLNREEMGSK